MKQTVIRKTVLFRGGKKKRFQQFLYCLGGERRRRDQFNGTTENKAVLIRVNKDHRQIQETFCNKERKFKQKSAVLS